MGGNQVETASMKEKRKATLGESLVAARERRGLSREIVVQQTHIPAHYVQMLEDDDYRRIPDQLYLLPFLRKYATFLDIDQDETAMRLLGEVQRADNSPGPVRRAGALDDVEHGHRRNWTKPILFSGLVTVLIGAYIAQSHHNDLDAITAPKLRPEQAEVVSASSAAVKGTVNSALTTQSASAISAGGLSSQPTTLRTRVLSRPDARSVTQAMVVPVAVQHETTDPPQRKAHGLRQTKNR